MKIVIEIDTNKSDNPAYFEIYGIGEVFRRLAETAREGDLYYANNHKILDDDSKNIIGSIKVSELPETLIPKTKAKVF